MANDSDGQGRGRLAEPHLVGEEGGGDIAGWLAREYPEKGPELVEAEAHLHTWRGMCKAGLDGVAGIDTEEIAHVAEDYLDDAGVDGSWLERLFVFGLNGVGISGVRLHRVEPATRKNVLGGLIRRRGIKLVVGKEIYDLCSRRHRRVRRKDVLRGAAQGQRPDADAHRRGRAVVAARVERDARDLELGKEQPPFALVGDEGERGAPVSVRRRDVLDLPVREAVLVGEAFETVARGVVERAGDVIAAHDSRQGVYRIVSARVNRGYLDQDGVERDSKGPRAPTTD